MRDERDNLHPFADSIDSDAISEQIRQAEALAKVKAERAEDDRREAVRYLGKTYRALEQCTQAFARLEVDMKALTVAVDSMETEIAASTQATQSALESMVISASTPVDQSPSPDTRLESAPPPATGYPPQVGAPWTWDRWAQRLHGPDPRRSMLPWLVGGILAACLLVALLIYAGVDLRQLQPSSEDSPSHQVPAP